MIAHSILTTSTQMNGCCNQLVGHGFAMKDRFL